MGEGDLQRTILGALALDPRVLVLSPKAGRGFAFGVERFRARPRPRLVLWRQNTGAVKVPAAGKRSGRYLVFGVPGLPDILGIHGPSGLLVGLEVKTRVGRVSGEQAACGALLSGCGAAFRVVRSLDDALRFAGELLGDGE